MSGPASPPLSRTLPPTWDDVKLDRAPSKSSVTSDVSTWSRAVSPRGASPPSGASPLGVSPPGVVSPLGAAVAAAAAATASIAMVAPAQPPPPHPESAAALAARRARALGANVASATAPGEPPLALVAASGCWAVAADGRRYLDCQNNVASVGHAHPAVSAAVASAWATLNTNLRYAHPAPVAHAEAVRGALPAAMDAVVYHTASGSEAVDLALRIAVAASEAAAGDINGGFERHHVVVLKGAYHGHAGAAASISPYYDHGGAPGAPPPAWVHVLPVPDAVRGIEVDGPAVARAALDAARSAGARVAAFIFEPIPSCAGQVMLPPGWLASVCAVFRSEGAALIADEVQTGVGRVGTPFAFHLHLPHATPSSPAMHPDAVILGKGIANGYPIGVAAVSRSLAAPFASRGRFFSTFGGSTASVAASLATLNVIARDRLADRAASVGARLLAALRRAVGGHPAVGAVRGVGLMVGVELVVRAPGLPAAPAAAAWAAAACRARGVMISADGFPVASVLKIKPPLVFSDADADALVATLGAVVNDMPIELYSVVDVA